MQCQLTDQVILHPKDFGKNVDLKLMDSLRQSVEGKYKSNIGLVIAVINLGKPDDSKSGENLFGDGIIDTDKGFAVFTLTYTAIVCNALVGEVVPATIDENINEDGFEAYYGPLKIWVKVDDDVREKMKYEYSSDIGGSSKVSFVSSIDFPELCKGSNIRVQIRTALWENGEMKLFGSISTVDYCL
jgi:DNA-directed RNA polymerase subunit E'/Rpb7